MNAVECTALQLLQQHRHEVSKKKPIALPKRKRGAQRREAHTDLCFARMHHSAADRQEGLQSKVDEYVALQAPGHSTRLRLAADQT